MLVNSFNVSLLRNPFITQELTSKIINLKKQYWNYSYEEHKKWLENNITNDDFHLVITDSTDCIISYLNIISTQLTIEDQKIEVSGIGNVCVDKIFVNQGIGQLTLNITNHYLSSINKVSLLLCKPNLVNFYMKTGWIKYNGVVFINETIYNGDLMLRKQISTSILKLDKNF